MISQFVNLGLVLLRKHHHFFVDLRVLAEHRVAHNCDLLAQFPLEAVAGATIWIQLGLLPKQKCWIVYHYTCDVVVLVLVELGLLKTLGVEFRDPCQVCLRHICKF